MLCVDKYCAVAVDDAAEKLPIPQQKSRTIPRDRAKSQTQYSRPLPHIPDLQALRPGRYLLIAQAIPHPRKINLSRFSCASLTPLYHLACVPVKTLYWVRTYRTRPPHLIG